MRLIVFLQFALEHYTESSNTSLLIGMFGFKVPMIRILQRGQLLVFLIQCSQKRL